jgi:diguanylate cyclase (GGDEF)-like protein/PAS domain S-box-containing protein
MSESHSAKASSVAVRDQDNFWIKAVNDVLIVAVTDPAGRIVHVNDRFCAISGYSRAELLGRNHRIVSSGTHKKAFFADMYRTIRQGRTWRGEICNRAKDGSLYWVATTIIPELDQAGQIARYVACRFEITEQKAAQQRLGEMASRDPLTGLLNRNGLKNELAGLLADSERCDASVSVIGLDIDNFKDVNDLNGHDVGDRVLRTVASRLCTLLEDRGLVARLGGDEIAIVLRNSGPDTASLIGSLQDVIRQPIEIGPLTFGVTASLGVAQFPEDGLTATDLMKRADIALYSAKRQGRDRCVSFEPAMLERTARRVKTLEQAAVGITRGEFELHYQPIVAIDGRSPPSCEALLRWRHPEYGLLTPGAFADVFESSRHMSKIGRLVQRQAIHQASGWIREGVPFEKIKFNTSTADFETPGYAKRLLARLASAGVPTVRIGVEVTEGMFLGQRSTLIQQELALLSENGIEIAFDDFGTGFASLTHLRDLPIDRLKIDRSFVMNINTCTRDEKIVRSIVDLAHSLDMVVTAEGVETEAQLEKLAQIGCDRMQGYLFAEVMPALKAAEFMWSWPLNGVSVRSSRTRAAVELFDQDFRGAYQRIERPHPEPAARVS